MAAFGAIAVTIVMFVFKPTTVVNTQLSVPQKLAKSGIVGVVILLADMTCLVLALQWGGSIYPWSDSCVWGLLLGFGLITILFIGLQVREEEEYVPNCFLSILYYLLFNCMKNLTISLEHSSLHESSANGLSSYAVSTSHSCN